MRMMTEALIGTRFTPVARMGYLKVEDLDAVLIRYEANRRRHYLVCDRHLGVRIGGVSHSIDEAYTSAVRNAGNFQRNRPWLSDFINNIGGSHGH